MDTPPGKKWNPNIEQEIIRAVRSLRYGSVEIIVHDSKVVQIERKEKIRLDHDSGKGST
ncbi:MAG TPA: YezD family protein [Candidatus Binatia bacterium]|jgi:hypothetical protein|nr:YezD family protein [Candidatus Binatia bacterium]